MRILLIYQNSKLPSSRIRILQAIPHLEDLGCRCEAFPYPSNTRVLKRLVQQSSNYDIVLLQKKLPSWRDSLIWRTSDTPIIYDYDDAVMLRERPRRGNSYSRTRNARFERVLRLASGVIAGNTWLASACEASGLPVLVSPSPLPFPTPSRLDFPPGKTPVIGWVGASGNLDSLNLAAPALIALARRRNFTLRVISDGQYKLDGVPVENVEWSLESQESELARLDVGIMPLEDTPWSRGKCAYKLLQYMAAGVPAVGSAVGMNTDVIREGENGWLVHSPSDWETILERAVDSNELRLRLGAKGRKLVAEEYTYTRSAERWFDFFSKVSGPTKKVTTAS